MTKKGYDPNQPRDPAGTSTGGQWTSRQVKSAGQAARKAAGLSPETTEDMYYDPASKEWDAKRRKLQEQWKKSQLADSGATPVNNPQSWMMGGGSAGGKGTIANDPKAGHGLPSNKVVANSDHFKRLMPEYKEMIKQGDGDHAAFCVHEESSYLAKQFSKESVSKNYNVILDGTGDGNIKGIQKKISLLSPDGRPIHAVYVTCPIDEALRRNQERYKRTKRLVPPDYLIYSHKRVSAIFPDIVKHKLFDSIKLYDTNVMPPKLIAIGKGDNFRIVDEKAYAAFLAKVNYGN